jgi:citrate synthase
MEYIPGLAGVPAKHSKISDIDGEKGVLYYRGYSIEDIAENSTFDETCFLLFNGELPNKNQLTEFKKNISKGREVHPDILAMMSHLPNNASPMHVLQMSIALLSEFFPALTEQAEGQYSLEQQHSAAITIISQIATLAAAWERTYNNSLQGFSVTDKDYAANFLYMLNGNEDPYMIETLDKCLILHAEHTINASTFTAMVTASTLANPCSVITAAIASLSGPLHGGANRAVVSMIEDIGSPANVEKYIDSRLKNKEVIWGMGHREYKTKDPRAKILEKMLIKLLGQEKTSSIELETAKKVEEVCEARLGEKGIYPNVDFYSGILYKEMGIRPELFTPIFAVSRTAGWLAHYIEQLQNNKIFRPTQIYDGASPRKYVSMEQR